MNVIITGYGGMFRALIEGVLKSKHNISGVLRHERVIKSPLKLYFDDAALPSDDYLFIKNHKLHEIKASSVNSENFRQAVKKLKADAVITGSWSEKFSEETLKVLPFCFVNVHPSLLPKYRGPNPYAQAILHNEKISGITFHLMDKKYDTGAVLLQKEVKIMPDDTAGSLKLRCCAAAKQEIRFLLDNFKELYRNRKEQNEADASYQSRIHLKEAVLEFEKEDSEEISRRIRAFSPRLKCFIPINGEFLTFSSFKIIPVRINCLPGTIIRKTSDSVCIACRDNAAMCFYNTELVRPFSKCISKIFMDKFVKVNDRTI